MDLHDYRMEFDWGKGMADIFSQVNNLRTKFNSLYLSSDAEGLHKLKIEMVRIKSEITILDLYIAEADKTIREIQECNNRISGTSPGK